MKKRSNTYSYKLSQRLETRQEVSTPDCMKPYYRLLEAILFRAKWDYVCESNSGRHRDAHLDAKTWIFSDIPTAETPWSLRWVFSFYPGDPERLVKKFRKMCIETRPEEIKRKDYFHTVRVMNHERKPRKLTSGQVRRQAA